MGAYTSREACDQQGFRLICDTVPVNATDFSTVTEVGGFSRGEYPENSDIAGIGVSHRRTQSTYMAGRY